MKFLYGLILVVQWASLIGGLVGALVVAYFSVGTALDLLTISLLALACLKLDVVSLAR